MFATSSLECAAKVKPLVHLKHGDQIVYTTRDVQRAYFDDGCIGRYQTIRPHCASRITYLEDNRAACDAFAEQTCHDKVRALMEEYRQDYSQEMADTVCSDWSPDVLECSLKAGNPSVLPPECKQRAPASRR